MTKKRIIWLVVIISIAFGGYFYYAKSKTPKIEYTTTDVARGNLAQTVSSTGTFNPDRQYELAFKTSGTVTVMNVDVGDQVKKGELLAEVDKGTLLSQLAEAKAGVKVQQETLDNLVKHKGSVPSTGDSRDAQRAQLAAAKAGVNVIMDQLKDTVIYSPIDGTVIKRFANVGEQTFINAARSTSILTVANGDMVIESNIPESDVVKLQIGQKAEVTFDALTLDEKYGAEIVEINPASTVIQDVVYYGIKFRLTNVDQRLKPGMSANVDISTAEKENVLMIPLRAVQTEGNQKFVEILNSDGISITKVQIETGLEGDEGMVEVTSGLQAGQKVVTFTKTL
ncbi:MAG TPA: efflux RND transporter periplasmic adaptor subunit [Patescibacteria group bacterium]